MIINFCTQVCNRRHQLEQTLPHNLAVLEQSDHKLLLLVVKGNDGTYELVQRLKHPNLLVYHIDMPYDIIKAKRLVHDLADGDYLFNLDADNFISADLLAVIKRNQSNAIHNWYGTFNDGTYGRIGMPKSWYQAVQGYPSYMTGAGAHDFILLQNLAIMGPVTNYRTIKKMPLLNDKQATIANLNADQDWNALNEANLQAHSQQPILIPSIEVKLPALTYGSNAGHLSTIPRNITRYELTLHTMRYWVTFSNDFDFGLGGKLPGFAQGDCPTGGVVGKGWSVRPMWRQDGAAEFYIYHPQQAGQYGDSFKLPIKFVPGTKHLIELAYLGNLTVLKIDEHAITIPLRKAPTHVLYHIFRGGHTPEWAGTVDGSIKIEPAA
mgnify:CR=1 FL=1